MAASEKGAGMSIDLSTGNKAHAQADRGVDLYETPKEAIKTLLALEDLPHHIWESACGRGAITRELESAGHCVFSSDIEDYNWNHHQMDFLSTVRPPEYYKADGGHDGYIKTIVTNPPYGQMINPFIKKGIQIADKVCFLLKIQSLAGQRRMNMLNENLSRVYVLSRRLPMMHRDDWQGKRSTSAADHAWFVFEKDCHGSAQMHFVDWKKYQ
jgi:hypothetical protein